MDGILALFQSIAGTDRVQLPKLLAQLKDHHIFQHKTNADLNPVTQKITDLLNDTNSKHEGILLLITFLNECPLDILEQKGALWITLCTKILAHKKPIESISLAYHVLGILLKKSIHTPELSKSISGNLLSKIIETIGYSRTPVTAHFSALKFLEIAMITFAGPCGSSKKSIESFVLSFIDSQNEELVKQAGKCLQLLQQIRGGGAQGISHKTAWAQLQSQLLGSLHQYLSELFTNTIDTFEDETQTEILNVPEIELSDEPLPRALQLETRFVNLCKYFVAVLVEPFPVPKSIQPAKILQLISRGLSVNCSLLSKNLIVDNIAIGVIIPRIHVALLSLLDSLISVLRSHMLIYGHNILQIMNQSLKWTASGKPNGFKRLYVTIRRATYFSLDLWCKTVYATSGTETIAEDLIQQIIHDITPYQNEVKLQALSGSRKYLSKKARQKLIKAQNESTNLSQMHSSTQNTKTILSDVGNEKLCASALICLNSIILSTGNFIKPTVHKILQEHIVSLAYYIVQSASLHANLYNSADCRVKLFDCLLALIMSPNHLCPPPLRHAAKIFSIGQVLDVDANVRNVCNQHLMEIEKILNPQRHTLYFPVNAAETREALKQLKNKTDNSEDEEDSCNEDDEILIEEMETDIVNNVDVSSPIDEGMENVIEIINDKSIDEKMENVINDKSNDDKLLKNSGTSTENLEKEQSLNLTPLPSAINSLDLPSSSSVLHSSTLEVSNISTTDKNIVCKEVRVIISKNDMIPSSYFIDNKHKKENTEEANLDESISINSDDIPLRLSSNKKVIIINDDGENVNVVSSSDEEVVEVSSSKKNKNDTIDGGSCKKRRCSNRLDTKNIRISLDSDLDKNTTLDTPIRISLDSDTNDSDVQDATADNLLSSFVDDEEL